MKIQWNRLGRNTLGGVLIHLLLASCIIVVLGVLYFYAYLPNVTNHGETITVPNIEGKLVTEVEAFLASHDLRYEVNDSSYSADYAPLTVLKQYPAAGSKVKENRKIYLSINRVNPPTVPVPDLIDGSVINAEALLRANELKRGRIELVAGPFNIVQKMRYNGVVIPAGTRVPKGSAIDLVVMSGNNEAFPIPDMVDMPFDEADVLMKGLFLSPEIEIAGDTTGGQAVVIKQEPSAETPVRVGDVIRIWVGNPGTPVTEDSGDE